MVAGRILLFPLLFVLLSSVVFGAVIEGDVYSIYLELLTNAVVTINTVPQQVVVAKDGHYAFTVLPGEYVITAEQRNGEEYYAEENITIVEGGEYTLDLLLAPVLNDEIEGLPELGVLEDKDVSFVKRSPAVLYLVLVVMFGILFALLWVRRKLHLSADQAATSERQDSGAGFAADDLDEQIKSVLAYLKSHGGRAHQKEIRRHFSLSEAKLSLLLTDMESRGLVRKIKKGRGNVVILV